MIHFADLIPLPQEFWALAMPPRSHMTVTKCWWRAFNQVDQIIHVISIPATFGN